MACHGTFHDLRLQQSIDDQELLAATSGSQAYLRRLAGPKNLVWDLCEIYHHQDPFLRDISYDIWDILGPWEMFCFTCLMFGRTWTRCSSQQENGRWERLLAPRIGDCEALWLTTTIVMLNPRQFKPSFIAGGKRVFAMFAESSVFFVVPFVTNVLPIVQQVVPTSLSCKGRHRFDLECVCVWISKYFELLPVASKSSCFLLVLPLYPQVSM